VPWGGEEREDDPNAAEFIRELGEGVQVFNLTKTLPVEPYGQSGPKLLTRNTTRRAWKASFERMRNIKRVAMLGIPGVGTEEPQFGAGPLARGDGPGAATRVLEVRGRATGSSFPPRPRMTNGRLSALRSKIGSHQPPQQLVFGGCFREKTHLQFCC
ncbi:unnamed protein product, partial [Symbiodinium necroappetens]